MNIKEAIDKLNSINLQDLKKIDLTQIKDILRRSPIIIFNIALILASSIVAITLISNAKKSEEQLKIDNLAYSEKLEAVKKQESIKQEYATFTSNFPKVLVGRQLIDKFSELATNRNVRILSFSPAKEKSDNHTSLTTVNLSIESDDYKNIILFVKDIEDFPFAIRLEKFSAKLNNAIETNMQQNNENSEIKENLINADIEVSSVRIR